MADRRHIENRLLAINQYHQAIVGFQLNKAGAVGHVTQTANFENSR